MALTLINALEESNVFTTQKKNILFNKIVNKIPTMDLNNLDDLKEKLGELFHDRIDEIPLLGNVPDSDSSLDSEDEGI